MKKQVLAFISLFGLVFVLSIYYVLLPNNLFVSSIQNDGALNVGLSVQESSNLYFTKLNDQLETKHNNIISSYEEIIASALYENEAKETALNMLYNQQKVINSEEELVSKIKEIGYYNAYVEYQDNIIKVIVQAESLSNVEVATIMTLVMQNSINDLLPEVSFVN